MENTNQKGFVRSHRPKIIALIRLSDIAIIGLSLQALLHYYGLIFLNFQVWWLLIAVMSFQFFAELNLLYNAPRGVNLVKETQRTGGAWLGVLLVFYCIVQLRPDLIGTGYKQLFWVWLAVVPALLILWHLTFRLLVNYCRALGNNTRQVAIIGATELGYELQCIFKNDAWLGFSFVGFFDDRQKPEVGRLQHLTQKLLGNTEKLVQMIHKQEIDIVYITLPLKAEKRIKQMLEALSDTTVVVYYVPDLFVFNLLRARMDNLSGIPIISIHDTPFYGMDSFIKRLFDIIVASFILILISIPLLLIAFGVKVTSPGPVIFKQRRYGFRGEEISVWKFRSMTSCDDDEHVQQATKNDIRITPFGEFLRGTSLDELPQFFNVIQGRMSIIGPRPHAVAHNEYYRGQIKGYMLRHKVKPGITGLAQIRGFRGETDTLDKMDARIQCDLEYIRDWSLMLDIKIFFLTIFKGFFSKKAY